jgi:hypothetical protein
MARYSEVAGRSSAQPPAMVQGGRCGVAGRHHVARLWQGSRVQRVGRAGVVLADEPLDSASRHGHVSSAGTKRGRPGARCPSQCGPLLPSAQLHGGWVGRGRRRGLTVNPVVLRKSLRRGSPARQRRDRTACKARAAPPARQEGPSSGARNPTSIAVMPAPGRLRRRPLEQPSCSSRASCREVARSASGRPPWRRRELCFPPSYPVELRHALQRVPVQGLHHLKVLAAGRPLQPCRGGASLAGSLQGLRWVASAQALGARRQGEASRTPSRRWRHCCQRLLRKLPPLLLQLRRRRRRSDTHGRPTCCSASVHRHRLWLCHAAWHNTRCPRRPLRCAALPVCA